MCFSLWGNDFFPTRSSSTHTLPHKEETQISRVCLSLWGNDIFPLQDHPVRTNKQQKLNESFCMLWWPLSAASEFISTLVLLWPPIFPGQCQIALLHLDKSVVFAGHFPCGWCHRSDAPWLWQRIARGAAYLPAEPSAVRSSRSCTVSMWRLEVWPCNASAPGTPVVVCSGSDHVQTGYTGIPVYARPRSGLPCWDSYRLGLAIVPLCHGTGAPLWRTRAPPCPFEIFWRVRYEEKLYYRCGPLPTPLIVMITKLSLIGIISRLIMVTISVDRQHYR